MSNTRDIIKPAASRNRNLQPNDYLRPNWVNVVETGEPCTLYFTAQPTQGDEYRVLNTTTHDITLLVENGAYKIELTDDEPVDVLVLKPGSMLYGMIGYSDTFKRVQFFGCITASISGGGDPSGDYLPKANPTFTGTMTGPVFVAEGPMGESHLTMSASAFGAFNLNLINLGAKQVLVESPNVAISGVAGVDGDGTVLVQSVKEVHVAAPSLRVDRGGQSDLIASFDQDEVQVGDPNTGYEDNPVLRVHGNSEFAMNPVLTATLAAANLDEMALVTKSQVFDVLNGTRTPVLIMEDTGRKVGTVNVDGNNQTYYLAGPMMDAVIAQSTPDWARFRVCNILGVTTHLKVEPRANPDEVDLLYNMTTAQGVDISEGIPLLHSSVWEVVRIPYQDGSPGTTILAYPIHVGIDVEAVDAPSEMRMTPANSVQ